jgi:hypothetical protein
MPKGIVRGTTNSVEEQHMSSTTVFTLKNVPIELANAFRAACHLNGKRYREVLLECMREYVKMADQHVKKAGLLPPKQTA